VFRKHQLAACLTTFHPLIIPCKIPRFATRSASLKQNNIKNVVFLYLLRLYAATILFRNNFFYCFISDKSKPGVIRGRRVTGPQHADGRAAEENVCVQILIYDLKRKGKELHFALFVTLLRRNAILFATFLPLSTDLPLVLLR
jgi:hypothetical protein